MRPSHLIGLVGTGIGASRSPALHHRETQAMAIPYAYRLIDIDRLAVGHRDLPTILRWMIDLGFDGMNVTHPCKQAIMPLLDEIDDAAAAIGAVNTVLIRDGRTHGFNTDWYGFAEGVRRGLPDADLSHVVQLGAGGAGAATAHAILSLGTTHLTLVDADHTRAEALARNLTEYFPRATIAASADLVDAMSQVTGLIHATPTGMVAYPGLPLPAALLRPDLWVAEIVYFPLQTELLATARALGCRTLDGGRMVTFQAARAIEIFTGFTPDAERMLEHFLTMQVE